MQPEFLREKVIDHFTDASAAYARRRGIVHREEDPIIVDFVRKRGSDLGRVLEVGGGTGYLLDLLAEEAGVAQFYNCELVYQAYRKQVNPSTVLVGGNALSLPFAESKFDYVIAKNLLHHLVGKTRKESKGFAQKAAIELRRVVKSGGHIIILEQYHQYRPCADSLFYLTLLLSMGSFQLEVLGIRPKVIVSFLTPIEIRKLFLGAYAEKDQVILDRFMAISAASPTSPIRFLPLLNRFGRLLLIKVVNK